MINALYDKGYKVLVKIIGDGETRDEFIESLKISGAEVEYYGKIFDNGEKIKLLGSCDFALNIMKSTVAVGLTTKSIDYLAMSLPIINSIKGDTYKSVKEEKIGLNYDFGQSVGIEELVNDIALADVEEMAVNTRHVYERYFTREAFQGKAIEILKEMQII